MLPRPQAITAHAVMTAILDQIVLQGRVCPETAHDGALSAKSSLIVPEAPQAGVQRRFRSGSVRQTEVFEALNSHLVVFGASRARMWAVGDDNGQKESSLPK
jgi:hypothetical protein